MAKLLTHTRRPDITFYRKGRILITSRAARLLSLDQGDVINISVEDGEYLLFSQKNVFGRHEARCYHDKKGSNTYSANSARLCRAMLDICKVSDDKASFAVGAPLLRGSVIHLPIITSNLI